MATISNLMWSLLILGFISSTFFIYLSDNSTIYGRTIEPQYNNYFQNITTNLNASEGLANEFSTKVDEGTTTSTTSGLTLVGSAIWQVVKAPFRLIGAFSGFITQTINLLGIPPIVKQLLFGSLFLIIIFSVVRVVVRAKT